MPKINPLADFSLEELRAEILRRENTHGSLNDYYFYDGMDTQREHPTFWIVHKRYYHLQHTVEDRVLSPLLGSRLPQGFVEIQESLFEYNRRDKGSQVAPAREEVIAKLQQAGATYLHDPNFDCYITHMVGFVGKLYKYSFLIQCDNEVIQTGVQDFVESYSHFGTLDEYKKELSSFVSVAFLVLGMDCIAVFHGEYGTLEDGGGMRVSVMERQVWESLPPEPTEEEDG